MPDDVKAKLEKRKVEITAQFDSLKEEHSKLSKRISEIQAAQVQLQGAYAEVESLLKPEPAEEATPKEEKKKK